VQFNPRISIVIPVYNGANFLREAIDSALSQTYKNLEVIVVNDGSDDGGKTEDIAKSYGDRIRYFYKENGGVASALNIGIREMTGEWFAWLSHDDMFSPNRIEEDMRVIRNNPEARVTFCKTVLIDDKSEFVKKIDYPIQSVTNPRESLLLGGVNMCAVTIHRSCFEKTGLFNESNKMTQDVEMSLCLSKDYKYYLNDKGITYRRKHAQRGTVQLRDQHKKYLVLLSETIKNNFTIHDFFPDLDESDGDQVSFAWMWLGDLYGQFGAYEHAKECYKKALSFRKSIFNQVWIKYIIGARMLNSKFFKFLMRIRSYI
jgi:glycosyltransferase involved in cell wall biosynthesis